jgi:hypothetical protein
MSPFIEPPDEDDIVRILPTMEGFAAEAVANAHKSNEQIAREDALAAGERAVREAARFEEVLGEIAAEAIELRMGPNEVRARWLRGR